ncbi:MAG: AraC family transcriptional regulator [Lachnospiraceae bacterium]|jgi:AraC-like DNA-binding protein|nr:AraC family transcriptional regulator [Lachnospiraceae bacterium]
MDYSLMIRNSIKYIENNLAEKISLDDLAKRACLSKYHYHRLFHKMVGESVNRYINKKRMENAAKELIETNQPIMEIALKNQYNSQEAFSRAFKKAYNHTPGQYRIIYAHGRRISNIQHPFNSNKITNIAA